MDDRSYSYGFREYYARKSGAIVFVCIGIGLLAQLGPKVSSVTVLLAIIFQALVWLLCSLSLFIPTLVIDNEQLVYRKLVFRPPLIIPISHLLSAEFSRQQVSISYKGESQYEIKTVEIYLRNNFLQTDQVRLVKDMKAIFANLGT